MRRRAGRSALTMAAALVATMVAACGQTPPGPTAEPSTAAPSGAPQDTPSVDGSVVSYADCSAARFGPPLPPLNPPAEVHTYPGVPPMTINVARLYRMTITTPKGAIVLCLQPELAPRTVNTIVTLVRNHFYDGLIFHRAVPNFVLQGGDPTGAGQGGPGFQFNDEPVRNSYLLGAVAMANSGANTNGSQFFICIGSAAPASPAGTGGAIPPPAGAVAQCPQLPPKYSLFGKLQSGLDVANSIRPGTAMTSVTVAEQV